MEPITGAALVGAGNLVSALPGASAARRQNRILADGVRQQDRAGMESAATMSDFLSQLRASRANPAPERAAFTGAMVGAPGVSALPTASKRFRNDAATATADARGYGNTLADLFARIRAPNLQRQREGEVAMDAGNALRPIQMRAQDDEFLTNLRAGQVQANPWTQMLGQGLSRAGSYAIANGGN